MTYTKETWTVGQKVTIFRNNKPFIIRQVLKINKTSITVGNKEFNYNFKFDGILRLTDRWNFTQIKLYQIEHSKYIKKNKYIS